MPKKSLREELEEAADEYSRLYSESAKELGNVASEVGSKALEKAKGVGSAVAKEARNYGRLYKEGLGMKPDTAYEKKKGGRIRGYD